MRSRSLVTTCLSPYALSNLAIAWACIIGGFSTLVLVPGPSGGANYALPWVGVVGISQLALAAVLVLARRVVVEPGPVSVGVALALGGIARGAVIALGSGWLGIHELTASAVVARSINSAVVTIVGVGLIGGTIAWRADFTEQYSLLLERAVLLEAANDEDAILDPSVIATWTDIKASLDETLQLASDRLASGASARDLTQAAQLIATAVDVDLRPASRAMWREATSEPTPARLPALLVETIETWRLPLWEILAALGIVVGLGSLVRSGLIDGGAYTLRYLIITGIVLWLSVLAARRWPGRAWLIGVATMLALPVILLLGDRFVGGALLGLPADPVGQVVVALATPLTALFMAMAAGAVRNRQEVLGSMQRRVDAGAMAFVARTRGSSRDARRLSVFMHHSVQSELSALAIRLGEAALTEDAQTMDDVRRTGLERLSRIEALDPSASSNHTSPDSRSRIDEVVEAWRGILRIDIDLPVPGGCRRDQWLVAERVIEEGLANSVRHGCATQVRIDGVVVDDVLELTLADDGVVTAREVLPGMGMQWLERVASGDWSLERDERGARLFVRIR